MYVCVYVCMCVCMYVCWSGAGVELTMHAFMHTSVEWALLQDVVHLSVSPHQVPGCSLQPTVAAQHKNNNNNNNNNNKEKINTTLFGT